MLYLCWGIWVRHVKSLHISAWLRQFHIWSGRLVESWVSIWGGLSKCATGNAHMECVPPVSLDTWNWQTLSHPPCTALTLGTCLWKTMNVHRSRNPRMHSDRDIPQLLFRSANHKKVMPANWWWCPAPHWQSYCNQVRIVKQSNTCGWVLNNVLLTQLGHATCCGTGTSLTWPFYQIYVHWSHRYQAFYDFYL